MLANFIDKIVSLKKNELYEINGETYSEAKLNRIANYIPSPDRKVFKALSAVCTMIKTEYMKIDGAPIIVSVDNYNEVHVFTSYRAEYTRAELYYAMPQCELPLSDWMSHEEAVIALKTRYVENEDTLYLLNLLGRICINSSVSSNDNGISQMVEARKGVSLKTNELVKPRVTLKPYRTFFDVEQPQSEFILRVGEDGSIKLIEADGGMWKIAAVNKIKEYFEFELTDLINEGKVIVVG